MSENNKITDFITYPKTFEKYKWYKPILVIIITVVLTLIFALILNETVPNYILNGGYEVMNTQMGQIFTDLLVIIMIPALYIGVKIVRDRPFSSYISSRGGWNYKLYLKALIIPFVLFMLVSVIESAIEGKEPNAVYHFSVPFLIAIIILVPLQCIAEELIFRGLFMQTFGAWFKIPVVAIILQSILFTFDHGYNSIGLIQIFVTGVVLGFFAWKTNGIEVSSAIHTANNFISALLSSFGLIAATSTVKVTDVIIWSCVYVVLLIILYYVGKKTNWFGEIPENS